MSVFSIALTFFLVTNPIGNSPGILALVRRFDFKMQRWIILREGLFALALAIFFQYFGEVFLGALDIRDYTVSICGGILLLIVAIELIFPSHPENEAQALKQPPYLVPIATPLLAGPGLLTIIMLYSKTEANHNLKITLAILLCWAGVLTVLAVAPYLQKILGNRGMAALEQLMGLILTLLAVDMLVVGAGLFMNSL